MILILVFTKIKNIKRIDVYELDYLNYKIIVLFGNMKVK